MKTIKHLLLITSILTLSSCANFTPRLPSDEKLGVNDTFIYGHFFVDAKYKTVFGNYPSMGLGLNCQGGSKYLIRFYLDDPVQIIKMKPSVCNLDEIVYSSAWGEVVSRSQLKDRAIRNLNLQAGVAYYLGNFNATTSLTGTGFRHGLKWEISKPVDSYESTTRLLHEKYPHTLAIQTNNLFLSR